MKNAYLALNRLQFSAPVIVRVLIGIVFLWHGYKKFDGGISGVEGMFDAMGVAAPGLAAPFVAAAELVGGAALILGVLTRPFAALLAVIMLGAIYYVKWDLGLIAGPDSPMPGMELDLALLAGSASLVFTGPGALSVDSIVGLEPSADLARPLDRETVAA